ncbi:MAG: TIGR00282 family metallophosphoesterase [Elusimicrobiota bacterium]|jgi:hypothetical protein
MRILFFGDIIGRAGRQAFSDILPGLKKQYDAEFVIVNAENAAHGKGITPRLAEELWKSGADVLTLGNHSFDRKEIRTLLDDPRLIRPLNYPPGVPGHGSGVFKSRSGLSVAVIQVMGRVYMPLTDDPFRAVVQEIEKLSKETRIILVDMHAEITAEKAAMGWHLDGRASAVIGSHTHVQTADERLLTNGTAYITDIGACGPYNSVIGAEIRPATDRFLTGLHSHLGVASGDALVCACVVDIDDATGKARSIQRIQEMVPLPATLPEDS